MNHKDTKAQRLHEVYFVLLRVFVPSWFKFKLYYYQPLDLCALSVIFVSVVFLEKMEHEAQQEARRTQR